MSGKFVVHGLGGSSGRKLGKENAWIFFRQLESVSGRSSALARIGRCPEMSGEFVVHRLGAPFVASSERRMR